jgi:nascent polypeptide-associated complex subunit alpha
MIPGLGGDPRAMAAAMKRMGMEVNEIPGVEEVIVRTSRKEYRFLRPAVSVMRVQGMETWQVQGKPTEGPRGGDPIIARLPPAPAPPGPPVVIPDEDVRMVMDQTGVDELTARKALEDSRGEIAEAIVRLKG